MAINVKGEEPKKTAKSKLVALMAKYGSDKKMSTVKSARKSKESVPPSGKVLDSKGRARQANAPELLTAMPSMRMPSKGSEGASKPNNKPSKPVTKPAEKPEKKTVETKIEKVKLNVPAISGSSLKSEFKQPVAKILEISKERETEKVPVSVVRMGAHAGDFPFYPSFVKTIVKENPSLSSKIDITSADSIKESIDKMSQDDKINLYKKFEKFGIYGSASTRKYQPTEEDLIRLKNK